MRPPVAASTSEVRWRHLQLDSDILQWMLLDSKKHRAANGPGLGEAT